MELKIMHLDDIKIIYLNKIKNHIFEWNEK